MCQGIIFSILAFRDVAGRETGDGMLPHLERLLPLLVLAVYIYILQLGKYPLQSWDEGWYAIQGQSVIESGAVFATETFLHDSLATGPQLKMPPLFAWLQTLSFSVLGYTEFAARLPSAAAAIALAVVIYTITTYEFDSRAGWIGALAWLSLPQLFAAAGGRQAIEDVLFTLVGTLFVYTAYRVALDDDPRWLLPTGIFAGLTLLTKGLNAGIFVIILLPIVVWRWGRYFHRKYTTACFMITSVIGGLWPAYMTWRFGDEFLHTFVFVQVVDRATAITRGDPTFGFMNFPYLQRLPSYLDPWIWFLIPASGYLAWRVRNDYEREKILFLVWWAGSVFVFFAFTGTHAAYIYPMHVSIVILIGITFAAASRGDQVASRAILAGIIITLILSPRLSQTSFQLAWEGMWGRDPTAGIIRLPAFLLLVAGILLWPRIAKISSRMGFPRKVSAVVPVVVAVLLIAPLVAPASFPAPESQRSTGHWVATQTDKDVRINMIPGNGSYDIHSFVFYSNREVTKSTLDDLNKNKNVRVGLVPTNRYPTIERPVIRNFTVRAFNGERYKVVIFE